MNNNDLRLATWNIAANKDIHAVMSRIAGLNIDICGFQEISLDPAADLSAVFNHSMFRDYYLHYAPELGIMSKYPLRRAMSFELGARGPGPIGDPETGVRMLQVAMLQIGRPLTFANTHLAATAGLRPSATRRSQASVIADILRPLAGPGPLILCGDFNVIPSSNDLAALRTVLPHVHAGQEATYVGGEDHSAIDFFWSSVPLNLEISVAPADGLSDHNIVVATIRGWTQPAD
jgi:endonuclease/exonuclease/phosphatase (EEP) superfamily protein YafD